MRSKTPFNVKYLFDGLDDLSRERCFSLCRSRGFAKGEILVAQGDRCSGLLILASGEAVRQKYTTEGECSTLDILEAGDVMGIEYLLSETDYFGYEIEAISSGLLFTLSRENLRELADQYSQIDASLQRLLADCLLRQDMHVDLLSQKSVRKKIGAYILSRAQSDDISTVCRLPASREALARYLALPRQSLTRELRAMTDDQLILVNTRNITVLNREALVRVINET